VVELDFSFEEDGHIYRNRDGIVRPSVTQSLKAQGIFDFSMVKPDVLENARRRGKNGHRWTAEYDNYGFLDESWLAEDEQGGFEAWLRFRREIRPLILATERPMMGHIAGIEIAGTPDREVMIGAHHYMLELKFCAAKHPGWGLQLADYEMLKTSRARCGHYGRMSVRLMPTGKYEVTTFEDRRDAEAAIAAVTLTEWDGQANDYNADHARDTLGAWMANHGLKVAA